MNIRGCSACMKCWENKNGTCIVDSDQLNLILKKMSNADTIIIGSPAYCGDVPGSLKTFMDRVSFVSFANGGMLTRKVAGAVAVARRAGTLSVLNTINAFFTIAGMVVVGSSYWNIAFGNDRDEVHADEEGIETLQNLGANISWIMQCIENSKGSIVEPDTSKSAYTNFIR